MTYKPYYKVNYNDKAIEKKAAKKKRKKSTYRNPYFDAMNRMLIGEHERMSKKRLKICE